MPEQAVVDAEVKDGAQDGTADSVVAELPEWLNEPQYAELLKDESNKNILSFYKQPHELAKAVVEKEKTIRSGFKIPKKLNDQQIAELRPHMDRINEVPEKPEQYDFVKPGEIDEDLDFSEQTKMELRAFLKESGIGKKAAQGLYERSMHWMQAARVAQHKAQDEAFETQRQKTAAMMQSYYGPQEWDRLSKKDGPIDAYCKSRAIDDDEYKNLDEALESSGLRNHPLLVKLIADAARMAQALEGPSKGVEVSFTKTAGAQKLSAQAQRAKMYPNTPASLGGGAPG